MDALNNVNTIISIVVGIFGIGGYIFGIASYLHHKAISSQQKLMPQQTSSPKRFSNQRILKRLSMLDWLEALALGIRDYFAIRNYEGIAMPILIGIIGTITFFIISADIKNFIPIIVFSILYLTVNLLFCVYFVGRRIEKKTEEINEP